MRTRQKKHIRVPITSRTGNEGGGIRLAFFALAFLILGGLIYIYATHPELLAELANLPVGKNMIPAPPL